MLRAGYIFKIRKSIVSYKLPPSLFKCRHGTCTDQIFLSLTRFIENISNIYIAKYIYYKNKFNDTNCVSHILSTFDFFGE